MSLEHFSEEQWKQIGIIYRRKLKKGLEEHKKLLGLHNDAEYDIYMAYSGKNKHTLIVM